MNTTSRRAFEMHAMTKKCKKPFAKSFPLFLSLQCVIFPSSNIDVFFTHFGHKNWIFEETHSVGSNPPNSYQKTISLSLSFAVNMRNHLNTRSIYYALPFNCNIIQIWVNYKMRIRNVNALIWEKKNILFVIIIMTNPFKMYHKNKLINTKYFFFFSKMWLVGLTHGWFYCFGHVLKRWMHNLK